MAETSNSPNGFVRFFNRATLANISLQGKIYVVRLLFCLTAMSLLLLDDIYCKGSSGDHPWLFVGGLFYPHLGQLLFGRLDISRRRGHALFLADGMFVGAVIATLDFALLPSIIFIILNLFNWMIVGGFILVASGILFMFLGTLTIGTAPDMIPFGSSATCDITNWLASLIAIGYFLVVAQLIHKLIGELRLQQVGFQARSDSADSAKAMAESALLAVLPTSAALQMAETGTVATESVNEAALLIIEFRNPDGSTPILEAMQDALHVCDAILSRHDIEVIKSAGSRILAFSRAESGLDDAVKAFLEIDNFYRDHEAGRQSLRGIVHGGPVTIGLVQPQRLNLDLFGPGIDELSRLAAEATQKEMTGLIVTADAYNKLKNHLDRNLILLDDMRFTCYKYPA